MELPTTGLLPEIDHARQRLAKAEAVDARRELVDNVYPLLHMITEMMGQAMMAQEERVSNAEIAIAELASVGDSIVLPELADSIDAVLALGLQICTAVEPLIADGNELGAVKELLDKYRAAVEELRAEIDDVTVEDPDGDVEPDAPAEPKANGKDEG